MKVTICGNFLYITPFRRNRRNFSLYHDQKRVSQISLLPKYQSLGSDRRGTGLDEHCAILYQPSRLQCLEIYEFWLSETPDIIGSITEAWGNPYPRMVTGAKFRTLEGQTLQFYNTHLDYYSDQAKDLGAKCIQEHFCQLNLTKDYLFLTGDFNVNSQRLPRQILTQPLQSEIRLKDALADLELVPEVTVVGAKVAMQFLENMVHRPFKQLIVKSGDTLDLGNGHVLEFVHKFDPNFFQIMN